MSAYSYGRGAASQFTGGGGRGQVSYPTNANAAAARPSSEHSYGAMAYPHIPSINESAEFGGNYAAPLNSYQRQSQNQSQRMNSNILGGDNRTFPAPNMEASAYNRHSNTAMQSGYSSTGASTPHRRSSVPPNVGINSLSNMQRSNSYSGASTDPAYSNRNSGMAQSSYPQPNMSNQSQHYGEGFAGQYASQHQQSAAYNRTNSMMKSSDMWDRTNQTRLGQASFSNPHSVNTHFPHKPASNQYHHSGMQYPSSQTQNTNTQMYAANNTSGMHSSAGMNMSGDGSTATSDLGIRGNQCVNSGAMMGQAYGNNQAMYSSSMGARMRMPNQRSSVSAGGMYNSMPGGNQVPGSLQKLRHYGPMPNSSSGYSRTSTRPGNMQTNVGTVRNTAGSASNTMGMQGGWQANNSASQSGYPQYSQNQTNMSTNVPFNGLPHNSNMQIQQPMSYNNNMGMSNQQQQTPKPQNFSGAVQPNPAMDNLSAPSGVYAPNAPSTGSTPYPSTACPEKVDSSSAEFPNNISAAETEAMIQQLNQDRIFSAELEKLARLSRNPTAEDFIADPTGATPVSGTGEPAKSSCAGSSTFQSPTSIDELLDGGGCVASSAVTENPQCVVNSNVNLSHANSHMQSPSTSVSGSFQSGSGVVANQSQSDQGASSSSAPHTPNSTANVGKSAQNKARLKSDKIQESDINQGKAVEGNENSVHHLQRMTQSIKDTSKQDDLMKVANSQHAEYLSHSSSDNYGSQNCIAALSAACRNIIADMDSSMPKQNSGQKVQSPLGGKNPKFDGASGFGSKSDALSGFGSGPPSVNSMGDQFVAPSSCMMTAPPNCMPMDSYAAFPNNFNGANPMPMPDFQGKYHDFLEQSLPMQMSGRRMEEKPRKGRRRRKSDEFSTEQLISCSMNPVKPKRKYRKRSTQNPPSVESMEGPLSVDNVVFTPLSENSSHQADDMGYRSATQTPNSAPNSWGMDVKMSCSDSISMAMSIADGNHIEHVSQDLLDSVFSPDTTMSSTTNQDMPESGNCVPQGSSPIMHHNQSPLGPPHLNNNHPLSADHKHNMFPPQSNNTVSSTGEANCQFISTSTHTVNGNVKHKDVEEAHPLEILQAQIKIQRKQFNLGETQQSQAAKNNEKNSKVENALPSDLEMDNLLSSEETAWYLSEDQPKDQVGGGGGGLWEDLCPKGQTNTSSKPLLLAMQS